MEETWSLLGLGAVLILSGFFSAINFSLRDYSRRKLEEILSLNNKEKDLEYIQSRYDNLLLASSTIRTVVNLVAILLIVKIVSGETYPGWIVILKAFFVSFILLAFAAVAIPQILAKHLAEKMLASSIPILRLCEYLLIPLLAVTKTIDLATMRLMGKNEDHEKVEIQEELLEAVHEGEEEGIVDAQERKMIESVMEMRKIVVGQIMTPRTEIIAIEINSTLEQIKQIAISSGYSRMPVYEDNLDNIVGMLYVKDLLRFIGNGEDFDLKKIMRQCYFVPETKLVRDLFREFRIKKLHIAIVLDEYGGTLGLITLEDIIEQIVGKITDEYEPPVRPLIRQIDSKTLEIDGRMRIDELNDEYKLDLPESEDYETIAGFIFSSLGKIPKSGETFYYRNLLFTILDASDRKINKVRLEILPEEFATKQSTPENPEDLETPDNSKNLRENTGTED